MHTQRSTALKALALGSLVCTLILAALVIALHVLRPQLNPLRHTISEYALGPDGLLMTIAFVLRELAELCLVAGLALGVTGSKRSWTGLVLLALATVSSVVVAIFPADRHQVSTLLLHSLGALLGFISYLLF